MKKLLLILLCLPMIGFGQGQVNCSLLSVADVVIDNPNLSIDILIYNGDTMDAHYTYLSQIIDSNGDTTSLGNSMYWFAHIRNDTVAYHYSLPNTVSFSYPISIYFLYTDFNAGGILDTCILSYTPMITPVLKTFVPDNNFENYLEANGMGDGIALNDSVLTANINTVDTLDVNSLYIYDLTGIEDFVALTFLSCWHNQLTTLDLSNNTALRILWGSHNNLLTSLNLSNNTALTNVFCTNNQLTTIDLSNNTALYYLSIYSTHLTTLDVSNNTALAHLYCNGGNLTSLDVSGATALTNLYCSDNQLTTLDLSNNTALVTLDCSNNQLTSLDLRNGNNSPFFVSFSALNNPNLTCINVDGVWPTANWAGMDPQHYFSNNCPPPSSIQEHATNKELLRTIDLLGRETKNNPLFYIYDDGTVEKKIIIE